MKVMSLLEYRSTMFLTLSKLTMIKKELYVVPIMGQAQQGCGFFVGNYFITAGHVIEESDSNLSIQYNGKMMILDKNKAIKVCYSKELTDSSNCLDYAIFAVEGVDSPLKLAGYKPKLGNILHCITYDTVVTKDEIHGIPTIFANKEQILKKETNAVVREESLGNFFACNTDSILKKGNSGSPLFDSQDKIVGILRGGTEIPECCIFQYTDCIYL